MSDPDPKLVIRKEKEEMDSHLVEKLSAIAARADAEIESREMTWHFPTAYPPRLYPLTALSSDEKNDALDERRAGSDSERD